MEKIIFSCFYSYLWNVDLLAINSYYIYIYIILDTERYGRNYNLQVWCVWLNIQYLWKDLIQNLQSTPGIPAGVSSQKYVCRLRVKNIKSVYRAWKFRLNREHNEPRFWWHCFGLSVSSCTHLNKELMQSSRESPVGLKKLSVLCYYFCKFSSSWAYLPFLVATLSCFSIKYSKDKQWLLQEFSWGETLRSLN